MNCPHCQQEMRDNYAAADCPYCGKTLPSAKTHGPDAEAPYLPAVRFHVTYFFLLFLGPPLLTLVSACLEKGVNPPYPFGIGFFGGGAAGIGCGILLGCRMGRTLHTRMLLSILFAPIMVVVCVALCCLGCNVGGYQLEFH